MNLREDKGWAYGAAAFIPDTAAQRPLIFWAPVQADKTGPAMQEMLAEAKNMQGAKPATEAELERVKKDRTLSLPGSWETTGELSNAVEEVVRYDLPDDYWEQYPASLAHLDLPAVRAAAASTLEPDHLIWVVVGDREKVEQQIHDAGFETIHQIDADGEPVG